LRNPNADAGDAGARDAEAVRIDSPCPTHSSTEWWAHLWAHFEFTG
jgi:hypothetical protein